MPKGKFNEEEKKGLIVAGEGGGPGQKLVLLGNDGEDWPVAGRFDGARFHPSPY